MHIKYTQVVSLIALDKFLLLSLTMRAEICIVVPLREHWLIIFMDCKEPNSNDTSAVPRESSYIFIYTISSICNAQQKSVVCYNLFKNSCLTGDSFKDLPWGALDDVVMGGVSQSTFIIDPKGGENRGPTGIFKGLYVVYLFVCCIVP